MATIGKTITDSYLNKITTGTIYTTTMINRNQSTTTNITDLASLDDLCKNFHVGDCYRH